MKEFYEKAMRDGESQGEQTVLFDAGRGCAQGPLKLTLKYFNAEE